MALRIQVTSRRHSPRRLLAELGGVGLLLALAWAATPILGREPDQFILRAGSDVYRIPTTHLTYGTRRGKEIAFCPQDLRGANEKHDCSTVRVSIRPSPLAQRGNVTRFLDETLAVPRDGDRLLTLPAGGMKRVEGDGWIAFLDFPADAYHRLGFAVDLDHRVILFTECDVLGSCFVWSQTDIGVLYYTARADGFTERWQATDENVMSLFNGWRVQDQQSPP
jgi:hypothetical protein